MIYYNEQFYKDVKEIIKDWDFEQVGESFTLKVYNCDLEPIITLTAELIADSIESHLEERHSECCAEIEYNQIVKVLKQNIDFDKINSELPKLWYENNTFQIYTKKQLLEL